MTQELRVLIVEDNTVDAKRMLSQLDDAGYVTTWTRAQTEAEYRAALSPDLDVILADFSLPQFGSRQALRILRESGLGIPLIIVSGSLGEDLAVQAMREGATDYLLKDRLGRLGRAVATALEQRRLRSAHQKAEAAAQVWRERYEAAVRAAGQVLFDWDPSTNEIVLGGDVERIIGFTAEELAGGMTRWIQLVHPDDLAGFLAKVESVRASGEACRQEYRLIRKNGEIIHVESRGHFLRDHLGRPTHMIGFVVDITERIRVEYELSDSRQILKMVLNSIPIGVFWKDRQSRYLGCNRMVAEAFGLPSPDAVVGMTDLDFPSLSREQAEFFIAKDRQVMDTNVPEIGIMEQASLADGRTIWMETSKLPMHDADGRVVGVLGVWQDVTERQRLEEQFRQSMKMEAIGRLAGGVAHDFNNLLTVINGYSDLLLGHLTEDNPLRELAQQVHKAGRRAGGLTRQLLAFSRKSVLVPVIVDLNALVVDMQKMLAPLIGEDVDLEVRPGRSLWHIKVDPGELEQVIMNLAINARDAMPTGGKLTIETANVELDQSYTAVHGEARTGEFVLLAVSDTGSGMTAETCRRLFEPFFTTKGQGGTGLGLPMAYGIIKQSGGHIEVSSELGVGSTFKIYLPREPHGVPLGKSAHGLKVVPRGTEKLLLTEDEEGVRKLARLVLERSGYTVIEACDGLDAVKRAAEHRDDIRLLITDVVMPNMSGPQVAARLHETMPALKVLYLSGYTDDAIIRHGILEGDAPFLQKPFSPDALVNKVREILDA